MLTLIKAKCFRYQIFSTLRSGILIENGRQLKYNKMRDTSKTLHLSSQTFHQAISNGISLVDFWADWCSPCLMQGPILDDVAKEIGSKAIIGKINVDDNQSIATEYGIRSIPTMILYKDGKIVKQFVGVQQKQTLVAAIKEYSK